MLFHRDMRIFDNYALNALTRELDVMKHENVLFLFIFNPDQISCSNPYYNKFAIQFMCESLDDLDQQIRTNIGGSLLRMYGSETDCITKLRKHYDIRKIYTNADITPFALKRSAIMKEYCDNTGILFREVVDDYILFPFDMNMKPIKAFHKFRSYALKQPVAKPAGEISRLVSKALDSFPKRLVYKHTYETCPNAAVHGGRTNALKVFDLIKQRRFSKYDETRNQVWNESGTTRLSAFLKFGCISVREMYWCVANVHGKKSVLLNELIWRSYFDYLSTRFPSMLQKQVTKLPNLSLSSTFHNYKWTSKTDDINRWRRGKTGIPIIDAAMNELHTSGFMHNRCRMIVAMYAVRNLKIDWHLCEQHFAKYLVDVAPAQNVGNWNWIISYRFTFNPWIQQKKFDPECVYIKRWLPKLRDYDPRLIHMPESLKPYW